jgi:hypothetical protein
MVSLNGGLLLIHGFLIAWALNMKQRNQLLSQANVYLRQNPADANMTMEELKQMVNSMSANQMMNRLQRYVSKVQGTNQY